MACSGAVLAQQVELATRAVVEQPLVVAGHDLVEHRLAGRCPAADGVVVDHVHHHPQPGAVERRRPSAGTRGAGRAVRVGGVGALRARCSAAGRSPSCSRRVAATAATHACCSRRVRRQRGQVAGGLRLVGPALGDGGEVERRQQVQVGDARPRPAPAGASCPAASGSVKAQVGAALLRPARCCRRWRSPGRDSSWIWIWPGADGRRLAQRRPSRPGASAGSARSTSWLCVEFGGQGDRVRVGDRGGDDLLRGRLPRGHLEPVVLARPVPVAGDRPDAGGVVAAHRRHGRRSRPGCRRAPAPRSGGRRPDRERRPAAVERRARARPSVGRGVHVVEHAGDLHAGRGRAACPSASRSATTTWPRSASGTRRRSRGSTANARYCPQVRELRPLRLGEPVARGRQPQIVVTSPVSSPSTTAMPPSGRTTQRRRRLCRRSAPACPGDGVRGRSRLRLRLGQVDVRRAAPAACGSR